MSLRWMKKAYQCANNNITRTIRGKPPIVPSNATDDDAEEYPLDEAYPLLLSPPPLLGGRRIGLPALLWVRIDFIFLAIVGSLLMVGSTSNRHFV